MVYRTKSAYGFTTTEQLCVQAYVTGALNNPVEKVKAAKPPKIKLRNRSAFSDNDRLYIQQHARVKTVLELAKELKRKEATMHQFMKREGIPRFKKLKPNINNRMPEIIAENETFFNVDALGQKNWLV